jgi:hypothetical protein
MRRWPIDRLAVGAQPASAYRRRKRGVVRRFANLRRRQSQLASHYVPTRRENILPTKDLIETNPVREFDVLIVDGRRQRKLAALAFDDI